MEKFFVKKVFDEQQKVGFSYLRIWLLVVGVVILMIMFFVWVVVKFLVVYCLKFCMIKCFGCFFFKFYIKRNMLIFNVDIIQKVQFL